MDVREKSSNEKRLIDADVVVENIEEWLDSVGTALIGNGLSYTGELMGCIEDAPTVEAIPVVRCWECKYRFKNNGHSKDGCPIIDANIWMDDDDFCSHGERKEGADNEH